MDDTSESGWRDAVAGPSPDGAPVLTLHALELDRRGTQVRVEQGTARIERRADRRARVLAGLSLPVGALGTGALATAGLWWPAAVVAMLAIAVPFAVLRQRRTNVVRVGRIEVRRTGVVGDRPAERMDRMLPPPDAAEDAHRGVAVRESAEGGPEVLVRTADGWVAVTRGGRREAAGTVAGWLRELGEPPAGPD